MKIAAQTTVIYAWPRTKIANLYRSFIEFYDRYIPIFTVSAFLLGILLGKSIPPFSAKIGSLMDSFLDSYNYLAPVIILIILAPVLARMMRSRRLKLFGGYILFWSAVRRLLACVWAVIFTAAVFQLPMVSNHGTHFLKALDQTFTSFLRMMIYNPYFYAIYLAIFLAILSRWAAWLYNGLNGCIKGIEYVGARCQLLIPLFMLAVGAYICELPGVLEKQVFLNNSNASLEPVKIAGIAIDITKPWGILAIYFWGTCLIAVGCFIWHFVLLLWTKRVVADFSIKEYFSKYWIRVYPLLWATSSESLATPLNLSLVKRYYPSMKRDIRRFVVGIGNYLNINGTLICVFIFAGLVSTTLGFKPSLLSLFLSIPIVFLIGYGVPGIPGELVLFAGPMAIMLGIPPQILPMFLALYIGLQLGLPDSFRTGNNSTDDCVFSILLNNIYIRKNQDRDKREEVRIRLSELYVYLEKGGSIQACQGRQTPQVSRAKALSAASITRS